MDSKKTKNKKLVFDTKNNTVKVIDSPEKPEIKPNKDPGYIKNKYWI